MLSGKRDGYLVPGVDAKLSARLSAGDSNLMAGFEFILTVAYLSISERVWEVQVVEYSVGARS
jgi:hypothetical protein